MKKIGFMTLLITASLLLTLAFPAAAAAPKAPAVPAPAAATAPAAAMPAPPPHPHSHEALEAMRAARHHMEQAEHIFQGHREEAIKHLDMAIHEAEICEGMR
jgi:hypothetical protein